MCTHGLTASYSGGLSLSFRLAARMISIYIDVRSGKNKLQPGESLDLTIS